MHSRSLYRLFVGEFVRRPSAIQSRYYGEQKYQWTYSKWNFRNITSTAVATTALSGAIAFVLHALTARQDDQSTSSTQVDDDYV